MSERVCFVACLLVASSELSQLVVCKMARWGDDKTLNFVINYRNHECLWNPRSPLYKNNIARNNAYADLLSTIDEPNFTLKMLKSKIKNLRSVYHTEFKKIESSNLVLVRPMYKPTICWFEEMHSFLKDSNEYRPTTSTEVSHVSIICFFF